MFSLLFLFTLEIEISVGEDVKLFIGGKVTRMNVVLLPSLTRVVKGDIQVRRRSIKKNVRLLAMATSLTGGKALGELKCLMEN